MTTLRTRFAKDILTEFLPPKKASKKVVVILGGLPSSPSQFTLMRHLNARGYWSFYPRYRGTWESTGEFLKRSPVEVSLTSCSPWSAPSGTSGTNKCFP